MNRSIVITRYATALVKYVQASGHGETVCSEAEADKLLSEAKLQIAAEKESALRDVRKEIALLSVQVAEKVLRHELKDDDSQQAFIEQLVDEADQAQLHS